MHVKSVFLNINIVKPIKIKQAQSETTRIYNPCGYHSFLNYFFFLNNKCRVCRSHDSGIICDERCKN